MLIGGLVNDCCRKYEVKSVQKFEEENDCELPKVGVQALHMQAGQKKNSSLHPRRRA